MSCRLRSSEFNSPRGISLNTQLVPNRRGWLVRSALLISLAGYFAYRGFTTESSAARVFFAAIVAFNAVLTIGNLRKWLATRQSEAFVAEWKDDTLTLPRLTEGAMRIAKSEITQCVIANGRSITILIVDAQRRTYVLSGVDWKNEGLAQLASMLRDAGVVTKEQ